MKRWDENEVDRFLDNALNEYSREIPREGLEQRVLANLAVEQRKAVPRWWLWLGVPACAALLIVFALLSRPPKPTNTHSETAHKIANSGATAPPYRNSDVVPQTSRKHHPSMRRSTEVALNRQPHARAPHMPSFPSPTDAEQARLLLKFVQSSPGEAARVVDEQEQFQQLAFRNSEASMNSTDRSEEK